MCQIYSLLFLSFIGLALTQYVHIPLDTEHSITRHMEGFSQHLHFNFTVGEFAPNQDLLFIVTPLDWISNPDILISSVNPFPLNVHQAEHICYVFGADVCPVPHTELQVGKVFFISVFCPYTCSYTLEVKYNTEKVLQLNKKETLYFTGEQTKTAQGQVVKFTIPQDFKEDHILIQAVPKDTTTLDYNLGMYINRGDSIPSSTFFQFAGLPSWHNGVSFSLKQSTGQFCLGCTYTMLITTGDDVIVDVLARSLTNEITINLQDRVYDFTFERQTMHYVLQIDTSNIPDYTNKDLNIELKPYTGNPNIYVNLNKRPEDLVAFTWASEEFGIEAIRITPEDRLPYQIKDSSIEYYYITISSNDQATFSILAYLDNKNNKPIGFGVTETGYVQQKQLETYILNVPAQTEDKYTLTIGLHVLSGNPDLYVKSCPDNFVKKTDNQALRELCVITEEDINQYNVKAGGKGFFVASNSLSGNEEVSFVNGEPACHLTSGECSYVIGVYGNSQNGDKSHYSLLASHNLGHTILQETVPIKHSIQINEYRYYKFTLPDDKNTMSLHFQLTPISGDAGLFSAKAEQFPTKERFQKVACFCSHILTYCGFNDNDKPLKGTYYLAVYGFTHATYTITALTRSFVGPNVIQLMEAVPHRFVFPTTGIAQQEVYFRFMVEFDPAKSSGINIFLSPLKGGNYKILVAEGFLPDQNIAVWTSTSNSISISSKDPNFIPNGQYFVSIVPFDPADLQKTDFDTKNWQFSIQYYSSSKNIIELVDGHSTIGKTSKEAPAFFRFAVNKDDEELKVAVTQFGKSVMLYLSTDQENAFPSKDKNNFLGQQSINLNRYDIMTFCHQQEQSGQITGLYCPVYVGVYADDTVEAEQEFTITIQKTGALVYIKEGVPDTHPVPVKGKYIEYAISSQKGVDIKLSLSTKIPLKAFATVYNTKNHPHKFEWKVQESEQNLIKDQKEHYGETILTISSKLWAENEESIVIIRLKNTENDLSVSPGATFTLTYGENVRYLMDSSVVFGRVTKDSIQYYQFSARSKALRVILTPLTSGLPEIYLSKIENGLPTQGSYDYRSQDPSNPSINLDNAQGSYYLAVYSPNNCSYSLLYTTLSETFVHVKGGVPISVTTSSDHEKGMYLVYAPTKKQKGFKVLYSKEAGNPELYLSTIEDKNDKNQQLPSAEKYQFSSIDNGYIVVEDDESGKIKEYVIFVKNDGSKILNKATVIISENDQFSHLPSGKSFKDSVKQDHPNFYYYISPDLSDQEHVEISVVVYYGSVQIVASTNAEVQKNPLWSIRSVPGKPSIELKIMRKDALLPTGRTPKSLVKGQTLYFVVLGDALYDVRITVGKRAMSLEDGIITTGILTQQEPKTFTFHSNYEEGEKKVITLVYNLLDDEKTRRGNMFPEIEIGYIPDTNAATKDDRTANDRLVERNVEVRNGMKSRVYKFIARKALYMISLTLPQGYSSTYSMSLNINGLVMLPPNSEMIGYLAQGNNDLYQVNIPEDGNLLLQFFECFGNLSVFIQSRESGTAFKELPKPTQENGYSLIQVQQGVLYIKVVSVQGWNIFSPKTADGAQRKVLEAAYKISSVFIPMNNKAPQQLFQAGNHGIIQTSIIDEGKYNITWNNVEIVEKAGMRFNVDVLETIYVSRSQKALDMAAKCQLIPDTEFVFTLEHGEDMKVWTFPKNAKIHDKVLTQEIELDIADTNPILYVKIAAKVQASPIIGAPNPVPVSVYYHQTEIDEKAGNGVLEKVKTLFGNFGLIFGVIVITLGFVWGCYRRRQGKSQKQKARNVQYEMSKVKEQEENEGDEGPVQYKGLHNDDETVDQEQNVQDESQF